MLNKGASIVQAQRDYWVQKIYVKRERLMCPFFIFIMDGPDNSHPASQSAWEEMIYISSLQPLPSLGECRKVYRPAHCSLKTRFLTLSRDRSVVHQDKAY